jgi:hypothetical protein
MGLFLVLFWYSAVFRRIYFAFRPAKFPIGDATGIGPQGFDSACPSHDQRPAAAGIDEIPVTTGKTGKGGRGGVVHQSAVT